MQLDSVVKYGKRSNKLNGKEYEFVQLPYWVVKVEVANALEKGDLLGAVKAVEPEVKENKESLAFGLWLLDGYKKIIEMEKEALTSVPDKKLKDAGIEQMNIFGELNVINSLAGGNILKYEEVKVLPYEDVFNKLLMDKVEGDINKKYIEIISK